jgi:hypothetical protein
MLIQHVVVDVEMFANKVVKELAICYGTFSKGFILRPPKDVTECSWTERKQNAWLSANMHFLSWESGEYDHNALPTLIQAISPAKAIYYAKGKDKCKLLSEIFGHTFIDLDLLKCPSVYEIECFRDRCESGATEFHKNSLHCAQRKSIRYYDWLVNNL